MSGSQSTQQQQGWGLGASNASNQHTANSNFGQNVWNGPAMQQLYGAAQNLFGTTNANTGKAIPGVVNYQQQAANQALKGNQGQINGGVYGNLGIGNQLMSSLNKSENNPSATQSIYSSIMGGNGNSYLEPLKASLEQNQANAQALNSGTNAAQAAASGMSGGSRQGVQDALMKTLGNQALTAQEAQMGYNTFNQDLQNKLGIAQQADSNTLARQQLMSGMLGQQQQTVNQGINNTGQIQGWGAAPINTYQSPWAGMQQYANTIGGPTVLNSGTSSNKGSGSSNSWGMNQSSGSGKSGGGGI